MLPIKIYDTDMVFGISRGIPLTYVQREADNQFLASLKKDKHIILFSCSKQGKTSLIKKNIATDRYIAINCEKTKTLNDIYATILKEASFEIELQTEQEHQNGSKVNIGLKALSLIGFNSASETQTKDLLLRKKLDFDINNVHDVIRALESVNFTKYIVIEDFHYLDEQVQEAFSFHLKIFNERSRLLFIILAVWQSEDRLSRFNGDLSGRLSNINVNHWNNDDLLKVIEAGETLLNIKIPTGTKEIIIDSSFGSVAILQLLCLDFCKANGILKTQEKPDDFQISIHIAEILFQWIEKQNNRFTNYLKKIIDSQIPNHRVYASIIMSIIITDTDAIIEGIHLTELHSSIQSFNQTEEISIYQLQETLLELKKIQTRNNILPLLFEYDDEKRMLHITDKFLFFWLNSKNKFASLEEIGVEKDIILRLLFNRF